MKPTYVLETHGDPLGTLQEFIGALWESAGLEALLVPAPGDAELQTQPYLLSSKEELKSVNPFSPAMLANSARSIPALQAETRSGCLGALLRPCELRAVEGMHKFQPVKGMGMLTISTDCLGTYPADDLQWRAERKGSYEQLSHEAIQFARQGGISAYRYRSSCQICISPEANLADVNINVIGLPVRQYMLVHARDQQTAERLGLASITNGAADRKALQPHEHVLSRLVETHNNTRERIFEGLRVIMPGSLEALIEQLNNCGECRDCHGVCPICSVNGPVRLEDGTYDRQRVLDWVVACAGCGMCEQTCSKHVPLASIFDYVHEQIQ